MPASSESDPILFRYTRAMAIADGVLVDATRGAFAEITRQHFPEVHLAMTDSVFLLIENSVAVMPVGDSAGCWHDILWMSQTSPVEMLRNGRTFKVGLRTKEGLRWETLKILFHPGDSGEACATVMLVDED